MVMVMVMVMVIVRVMVDRLVGTIGWLVLQVGWSVGATSLELPSTVYRYRLPTPRYPSTLILTLAHNLTPPPPLPSPSPSF